MRPNLPSPGKTSFPTTERPVPAPPRRRKIPVHGIGLPPSLSLFRVTKKRARKTSRRLRPNPRFSRKCSRATRLRVQMSARASSSPGARADRESSNSLGRHRRNGKSSSRFRDLGELRLFRQARPTKSRSEPRATRTRARKPPVPCYIILIDAIAGNERSARHRQARLAPRVYRRRNNVTLIAIN